MGFKGAFARQNGHGYFARTWRICLNSDIRMCVSRKGAKDRKDAKTASILPHTYSLFWIEVQRLSWLHRERVIPGVQIAHRCSTVLVRCMTVRGDLITQRRFSTL